MKNLLWLICVICIGCGSKDSQNQETKLTSLEGITTSLQNADTLWIDKFASNVNWIGRKVTGEHNGHIQMAGGFIVKNKGKLESGEILINMQSITVDDIENPIWNEKLVTHLKDNDFFNSEEYPTAKFVFNRSKGKGADTHVSGEMTIRNKSVFTDLILNVVVDIDSSYATGNVNIDRTLFDIKYGSGSFFEDLGDKMIMDEFSLSFKVIAR